MQGKQEKGESLVATAVPPPDLGPKPDLPLVALLKTFRDEFDRLSRDAHRLSMLADRTLVRLELREEQPIAVQVTRQDEDVKS